MLLLKGKWFRCSSFFGFGEIIRFPLPAGLAKIEEPNFGDKKSKATTTAGGFFKEEPQQMPFRVRIFLPIAAAP